MFVCWNRYGIWDRQAASVERRGGVVLVAENGYLGNDFAGSLWYAISRSQHNGAGQWPMGDAARWDSLGVDLAPWRQSGETVVLPQRGIGPQGVAMPAGWVDSVQHRHGRFRVRPHPGQNECVPLDRDLDRAGAVVTWGSGAALKALLWGIPVFYDFPRWIGASASRPLTDYKLGPRRDDGARLRMFHSLAWAQWRLPEIESGEAFWHLLGSW